MQRLLRLGGGRLPRAAVLVGAGGAAAGGALLLHTTATSAQCLVDEAARPAAGLPSAAVLDQLKFKETHKGQLTPPAPLEGASETSCGPTAHDGSGIVWQRGPYRSWWLRLGIGLSRLPSFAQLSTALDEAIQRAKETKPFGTAVYVGVQELAMEPGISSLLRARGFQYHHFHASRGRDSSGGAGSEYEPGEHIYYRWLGDPTHDLVPPYRTSIEGVGALLLSPDEKRVLLVWEYGNWKPVSGAVDEGESSLRTIEREMHEEVHVPLDHSFIARKVGGWQMARARDGRTNDNYVCYALRAGSEAFEVDGVEINSARWFDTSALLSAWRAAGAPGPQEARHVDLDKIDSSDPTFADLPAKHRKISTNALCWLHNYVSGGGLACEYHQRSANADGSPGSELTFFGAGTQTKPNYPA